MIMRKTTPENVKLKDWIYIGIKEAVVCGIDENNPNKIEAVYLDNRNQAIVEFVQYNEGHWDFVNLGLCGGYADNILRLGDYVRLLRAGNNPFWSK